MTENLIKVYKKGEKESRGYFDIDTETMTGIAKHVTQLGDGSLAYLVHPFDLSEITPEELVYNAIANLIIKKRKKAFKDHSFADLEKSINNGYVFRPENYPADRKSGGTPVSRATTSFGGMCDKADNREQLVAEIRRVTMASKKLAEQLATDNRPDLV
jgi:hypothetical protein